MPAKKLSASGRIIGVRSGSTDTTDFMGKTRSCNPELSGRLKEESVGDLEWVAL